MTKQLLLILMLLNVAGTYGQSDTPPKPPKLSFNERVNIISYLMLPKGKRGFSPFQSPYSSRTSYSFSYRMEDAHLLDTGNCYKANALIDLFWEYAARDTAYLYDTAYVFVGDTSSGINPFIYANVRDTGQRTVMEKIEVVSDVLCMKNYFYFVPGERPGTQILEINLDMSTCTFNVQEIMNAYTSALADVAFCYILDADAEQYPLMVIRLIGRENTMIDRRTYKTSQWNSK